MDDNDPKENPSPDFNKLDLTQLQNFSFGTQWTQDKSSPSERGERSDRPRRDDRRDDRRDGPGDARRDRRAFRKPAMAPDRGAAGAPAQPEGGQPQARRPFRGGPRQEGAAPFRGPGRGQPQDRAPYDSPYFSATFYPEDNSFNALAKTIRGSCRTVELFEIARTVIGKNDRFVVVLTRKAGADAARLPIYLSAPDGMPFESEEEAVNHVMAHHLDRFFTTEAVEIDPPKGNYQVINKCGLTGELLGPPNYHRYNQIVQQHFAAKIKRMSLEAYRSRIESVRDPEAVAQWLDQMKRITRYTWKAASAHVATAPAPTQQDEALAAEPAAPNEDTAEAAVSAESAAPVEVPVEAAPVISFDSLEDARIYLLSHAREKVVRPVETARFHGNLVEKMPDGEIRRAIEGTLERQRRFPLDTANGLRGRLRREHFTIFKKGSKGVSYVCAVKRKFRSPGQTFSDSIGALINFIEEHPMIKASELITKFLGIDPALTESRPPMEPPAPAEGAAPVEGATPATAPAELTIEQRASLARMQGDLRWLVSEGYVTEFIDGRLFAPPPMVEARKREVESDEHDPENFPDVPAETEASAAPKAAPQAKAPAETPAVESEPAAPETAPVDEPKAEAAPEQPAAPAPAAEPVPVAEPASTVDPVSEPPAPPAADAEPVAEPVESDTPKPTPSEQA